MSARSLTFDDTGLLPAVIAEDVLRQLGIEDRSLIEYVEQRTETAYRESDKFRSGLSSTDPRGWYRMWVEHWIRGEHHRRDKRRQAEFQERQQLTNPREGV